MTTGLPDPALGGATTASVASMLDALLRWRRDVRHFRADPLPDGMIEQLLEIAQQAPSVGNSQPWRFVRIRSRPLRAALADHADAEAAKAGQRYAGERKALYDSLKLHGLRDAPEVIAVFCDEEPVAGEGLGAASMPETRRYSTVLAIHNLWLAARARGIGLGWVSLLDPAWIAARFDAPPQWHFIALLCLGYPIATSETPELEERGWQARQDWRANVSER